MSKNVDELFQLWKDTVPSRLECLGDCYQAFLAGFNAAKTESNLWQCPECGYAESFTPEWLADHGEPVCPECDTDMELVR